MNTNQRSIHRLEYLDLEFYARLRTLNESQRRRALVAICEFVLTRVPLEQPLIREAVGRIETGDERTRELRSGLQNLVDDLDRVYFVLREAVDAGKATGDKMDEAFAKARTASAICFAAQGDVVETAYEASAATDLAAVKAAVDEALL